MGSVERISVIIPVYNGERYLAEAIESALGQTRPPDEVILIDDGSTDGSADVARGFGSRIQYHYQPQGGIGVALNTGVHCAGGDWFAFLDADDLWVEDKLARQTAVLERIPECDMVFGHVQQFHSPDLKQTGGRITDEISPGRVAGTMLIRRDSFFTVGPLRTDMKVGQFVDWYARAVEMGLHEHLLPEVLLKRRIHDANIGIRERNARSAYVRILKEALDRRRKNPSGS